MVPEDWYRHFYDEQYLRTVQPYVPESRTLEEVKQIVDLLEVAPGGRLLDLCCGQGRHTIALAARGYRVTGLDLSAVLLAQARAADVHMTVNWLESDMRHIPYESEFDGIFNVFVSFGLLETDAEDQRVLEQVRKALKPGGRFLLETLHRDGWLRGRRRHSVDRHADNSIVLIERDFDPVYGRNITRETLVEPDGQRTEAWHSVRIYAMTELIHMLTVAGLNLQAYYGGLDRRDLTLDTRHIVVVACKPTA